MTVKDGLCSQGDLETVRVLLEALRVEVAALHRLVDERHALYAERDTTRKEMIQTALVAQEKLVNAAFAASKEAILKAEESQKGVNERSNEFRGQLADQAGTLMPRKESESSMQDLRDRVERAQSLGTTATDEVSRTTRSNMEELKREMRAENDKLLAQIAGLRESRSATQGQTLQQQQTAAAIRAGLTIAVGIMGLVFGAYFGGGKAAPPPLPPVVNNLYSPPTPNAMPGTVTDSKSTTRVQP